MARPQLELTSTLDKGGIEATLSVLDDLAFIGYLEGSDLKRQPENPRFCKLLRSEDGGRSWSSPQLLEGDWGSIMPDAKIIRLRDSGRLMLSAWGFKGWLDRAGFETYVQVLVSDDDGQSFSLRSTIRKDPAVKSLAICNTSVIQMADGRLLAIMRGDAHKSGAFPYGLRSISADEGRTWTPASPININICEPRLLLDDGQVLLLARSWPGNVNLWYRPLREQEREPGSSQIETLDAELRDDYQSPVREFGVMVFTTEDDGQTWRPVVTMENPRQPDLTHDMDILDRHRYQAAYPDMVMLDDGGYLVAFRQPDPKIPNVRPGLTYSHVFQRFLAANIIARV